MKQQLIEKSISDALLALGLNLEDANLKETPMRVAKMLIELTKNIDADEPTEEEVTTFSNDKNYDEIIMLDNIPFTSLCSHHLVFFSGLAYFLYLPNKLLIGASKVARLINFYSSKPQIQENLGIEIVDAFEKIIAPKGCMLVMRAVHSCMSSRGVKTGLNAGLTTSITRGVFRTSRELEAKGLALIQMTK